MKRHSHLGLYCDQHTAHKIDCEAFAQLLERANGACEVCGMKWDLSHRGGRPRIDHDHDSPIWAVRGLLCHRCNLHLGRVERGQSSDAEPFLLYLCNAWYRTDGLSLYLDRARRWDQPSARADRATASVALFSGATVSERYRTTLARREAWCATFLAQQPALF